jgi:hypothetical protein
VPGIWRIPIRGGGESLVTDRDQAGLWRAWRVAETGIYHATSSPAGPRLNFLDFRTVRTRVEALLAKVPDVPIPSLAVSPDASDHAPILRGMFSQRRLFSLSSKHVLLRYRRKPITSSSP